MQEALDRCEYAIRHQQEEIARLRAELEHRDEELTQLLAWINGDSDALTVLQRTYMDPRTSTSDRIKACGAAIGYERYKVTLAVSARSSDVLGDCLDAARALKTVNPKVIEHDPPSGPLSLHFFLSTYRIASLARATMLSTLLFGSKV
jgi:hypothetical protein